MTYYHLPTSTLRGPGRLEAKLSDGAMLGPPDTGWTAELAALCGFAVIVETAAPTVTASQVAESAVTLPGGVPTRTWTVRAKTQAELDADLGQANRTTLETQVRNAYTANRAFLALATPTNAQVLAQTKLLTKELQGVIRMLVAPDLLSDAVID